MDEIEIKEKSTNHYTLADDRPEARDEGLMTFIWNPKTGEVLGRSGMSWAKITLFYIIFYICLGIFVFVCYNIFAAVTLQDKEPRWKLDSSLIGSNPGVGFRPMPDQDKNTDSSLIWINLVKESSSSYWVDELDAFFKRQPKNPKNGRECKFNNNLRVDNDHVCNIDPAKIPVCNRENDGYGYFNATPCVLIKLNKIYDFVPEPYTLNTLKLAKNRGMPDKLRKKVEDYATDSSSNFTHSTWISCDGENPLDKETIGPLAYYAPGVDFSQFQGIPNFYYPYQNQEGYQTPFLFVKFLAPARNTLIQVECKAWAVNIEADRLLRLGSVHFELLID